jgi:tetratricopeptide (TPR) repeat protein
MRDKHRSQFRVFSFMILLLGACLTNGPIVGHSQTVSQTPLPPAAQEAVDKGIIAAKVPDYLLAIRFFEEGRKIAPQASVIYLNLGLAESRIPGRELRAIAWFGAYLAANPTAPNAAAVKDQIAVLEVRNESNVSNFIRSVQAAASQMSGYKKVDGLQRVVGLWAKAGDITAALNTSDLCEDTDSSKSYAYSVVAEVQAKAGDIAGARKTADMIPRKTDDIRRDLVYLGRVYSAIAEAQSKAGDLAGAKRTFEFVVKNSELIPPLNRSDALQEVVEAQARSGDITGAQKTVDLMPDDIFKKFARDFVAKFGAANVHPSKPEDQPAVKGSDWLYNLDNTYEVPFLGNRAPLKMPLFLDLAGYLKSLKASYKTPAERMGYSLEKPGDDKRFFDALHETAEGLISAQIVIHQMLKQRSGKP